jgi:integrase
MTGKLTDKAIRAAKADAAKTGKRSMLFDGGGMFLLTLPNGAQYWRMKCRPDGRERLLAFGVYPDVSLKEARQRRDDARLVLRNGGDPARERRERKAAAKRDAAETFGTVAAEWLKKERSAMAPATLRKAQWTFGLLRSLDAIPVAKLKPADVLATLRRIESTGAIEAAHRAKMRVSQVMRYAIATGRAEQDPTYALRGALKPRIVTSRAAITDPIEIGKLLRAIDAYSGQPQTQAALKLAPLLFVRPGNLRAMEWTELNLEANEPEWRIPAGKMKMREAHIVPLPDQAVAILREIQLFTGTRQYVFPSLRNPKTRCMSENTVNAALRNLGYGGDEMVGHGFRAMASTLLNELGWQPDVIERALAHAPRNRVRAAYNRASYMAERRKMAQAWADHLDGLKADDGRRKREASA